MVQLRLKPLVEIAKNLRFYFFQVLFKYGLVILVSFLGEVVFGFLNYSRAPGVKVLEESLLTCRNKVSSCCNHSLESFLLDFRASVVGNHLSLIRQI
jgi:hypothetical protein